MNITEDYVSFEIAVILKEKGFDKPCITWYNAAHELRLFTMPLTHKDLLQYEPEYLAPTHQMALKWLREEKKIFIDIMTYTTSNNIQFRWVGYDNGRLFSQEEGKIIYFNTYEAAVEAALKYSLENLI